MAITTNAQLTFENNILRQHKPIQIKIDQLLNYQHIHSLNGWQYIINLSFYNGKASGKAS